MPIDAGRDRARARELEDQTVDADEHQDDGDVGIGDDGEQPDQPARLQRLDRQVLVASTSLLPATSTVRPSIIRRSSAVSRAMISITRSLQAALADRLAASRTAFSAHSALRPRSSARLRM